jgi:hypothetical protein
VDDGIDAITGTGSGPRARTIVIRCWTESAPGRPDFLRGTIRDLSRNGHIAFDGIATLTSLIQHMLAAPLRGEDAEWTDIAGWPDQPTRPPGSSH